MASGLYDAEFKVHHHIWKLLEEQLDTSIQINYRVHHLQFFHMRQKTDETITDYTLRLREKATKCEFGRTELDERLIEMIILSTPLEVFCRELPN